MMDSDYEDDMRFFRKGPECKKLCTLYKSQENIGSNGVVNKYRCNTCNVYLYPAGITGTKGNRSCKCCRGLLLYVGKLDSSSIVKDEEKLSTPIISQNESDKKTYSELLEFIEEEMKMQTNYQLVMLKFLVNHKIANKGQISEDLAYYNNKNIQNLDEIKKYFTVPVYQVLENRGFVKKIISDGITEFILNVDLKEFQSITLNDLLEEKIKNYNLEHNIPENQFDTFSPIEWSQDKFTVRDLEVETREPNLWIWSVTSDNWEIVKSKNIWGSKIPKDKIELKVQPGDQVAFYVIGSNFFKGIFEFVGEWYDSPGETWYDDLESDGSLKYKSQIRLKPILFGSANISDLYEKLDLFIGKPQNSCNLILQGSSGYPSNNNRALVKEDFEIIKQHLRQNPDDSEPIDLEKSTKIVKECPKCHIFVEGISGVDLDNKIEEVFGYRQFDPNDPQTRKLQSYCRKCRTSERVNRLEENQITEPTEEKVIETKEINSEHFLVFNSQQEGITIKHYELQHTDVIQNNQSYTNDELMEKFGVGNMGGIRYSRKNNLLILCTTHSNHYSDEIDRDAHLIKYTGEGQIGDQTLTGGNLKIVNSENIPMLFFQEIYQEPGSRKRGALDNNYSFIGKVKYLKHYWKNESDRNGNQRQVIKFVLEIE